jgi:hypothetical protein
MTGLFAGILLAACSQAATAPVPAKPERTPTAAPTPTPGMVLLDISGSDSKQSQVFTAPDTWDVTWEVQAGTANGAGISVIVYDTKGNFVDEVFTAQLDPGGQRSDVTHMHHAGTFYLGIDGIGSWHIKAVTA